ncbi:MAG: 4-alpha-glucanotransferase, partial [Catenibacterium sp.]
MKAGILCPISALPSSYGVGDFGKNAYTFVDQLKKSDVKIWQILPLNPLAYGNSPYQPYSSYAGDELYIDLEDLVNDGLLEKDELKTFNKQAETVEYEAVR